MQPPFLIYMKLVSKISRLLLGLLFIVSALLKCFSIDEFGLYIYSFEFFSYDFTSLLARVLISFEFLLGVFILSFSYIKLVNFTTLATVVFFSAFLLWRVLVGDENSCHCFGTFLEMDPKESLLKNILILILLALSWKVPQKNIKKLILGTVVVAIPVAVFALCPPDFFYRLVRDSDSDLIIEELTPQIQQDSLSTGRKFLGFYSPYCPHCRNASLKASMMVVNNSLPVENIHIYIMGYQEQRPDIEEFFQTYGSGLNLSYTILEPITFINITSGTLPLYVLIEDGKFVKEYDYLSLNEEEVVRFLKP